MNHLVLVALYDSLAPVGGDFSVLFGIPSLTLLTADVSVYLYFVELIVLLHINAY